MEHTLITGASKGIGKALAAECAMRGMNLILVALENEDLENVARQLHSEYNVVVRYKEVDLTEHNQINKLYDWCIAENLGINVLINNAGYSIQEAFGNNHFEDCIKTIRINVEAVALMSSKFLPLLKKNNKAYILNMGSLASFMHLPYKALYSASKNFVMALSNALHYELKGDNIIVSCLCPGPTITNKKVAARTEEQGLKAKVLTLTAEEVARAGVKGMLAGKRIIIPGVLNKMLVYLTESLPKGLIISIAAKIFSGSK